MKKPLLALALLITVAPAAQAQKAPAAAPKAVPAPAAAAAPKPPKLSPADQTIAEHAFGLGLVAGGNGQEAQAITNFSTVIKLQPDNQQAYVHRGISYYNLRQYDKAVVDFTQAWQLDATDTSLLENRAYAYMMLKQFENAIMDLDKNLAANPGALSNGRGGGVTRPLYARGLARIGAGDLAGGYGDIELAHKQDPNIEKYFERLRFTAPPAKPKNLPAMAGQSPARVREALDNTDKFPLLVAVTIIDDRSKASVNGCVTAPALLTALEREQDIAADAAGIAKAKQIVLANKTRVFHFSKQPALDAVKIAVTQKDLDDAKKQMDIVTVVTYDGVLPGYRLPAGVTAAIACSFVQQGKQVRMAQPDTIVLP